MAMKKAILNRLKDMKNRLTINPSKNSNQIHGLLGRSLVSAHLVSAKIWCIPMTWMWMTAQMVKSEI